MLIFTGDEVLENILFEANLMEDNQMASITATDILGNVTKLNIPSRLYVWHVKKKLADGGYQKNLSDIQLLMNSKVLQDHQRISSIATNNEIQVQVLFTQDP